MSQLDQFVEDVIKTESRIDSIEVNEELLTQTISILIHAGNILDQIKKNTFYGKRYGFGTMLTDLNEINEATKRLNAIDTVDIVDAKTKLSVNPRIFHSIIGISTEAVELLEALDIKNNNIDSINIAEEFGDIAWYIAIGVDELNVKLDKILDTVIKKLKSRYPNAFTTTDAINRDLEKERKILDTVETKE